MRIRWVVLLSALWLRVPAFAANSPTTPQESPVTTPDTPASDEHYDQTVPVPTFREVKYGPHQRNVLDFWQAKAAAPTPLVLVIHGGGWLGGSKERLHRFADASKLLAAGISVAAINYRLIDKTNPTNNESPPVKAPLDDAARALQFLRSKAAEWNLDPDCVGLAGGSAGGCSSLWLAYHDDLADPKSADPVARQSTRVRCVAVLGPQTTLDPQQMATWTPNSTYGGHAFGKGSFANFLASREEILPWIAAYSPYALASAGDPPVYLFYNSQPDMGQPQKDPTHTANFGLGLQARCQELGLTCQLLYGGIRDQEYASPTEVLIAKLKASR